MKITFKKTLLICAMPLFLTACGDDSDSKSATDIAAEAQKTVLEGAWTQTNEYGCTDTLEFTGNRSVSTEVCSKSSSDGESNIVVTGIISVGEKTQDSTQLDVTQKTISGYYFDENNNKVTINNDTLYNPEEAGQGKLINGKTDLGLFKIEGNKVTFVIDDEYRDAGRDKSTRPSENELNYGDSYTRK